MWCSTELFDLGCYLALLDPAAHASRPFAQQRPVGEAWCAVQCPHRRQHRRLHSRASRWPRQARQVMALRRT